MTVIALLLRGWQWLDSRATQALLHRKQLHRQLAHLSPHLLRDLGLQTDQVTAPSNYRLTTFSQRITDYDR
ncbi:hypothetical protein WH50_25245 [Pokkaliibacter plantistimulans]|uniref:DUF1127 domain-containing protein n=1 Tax=Pokkaliibacter plantistimulans TaxID=1635171 RepID=A0ABX5LTN1_9GAMM|nr:DUF1127 domain-containing protein [Pokkaliibacter plantistimulans]PXF28641.1 hypothetical protein WH50_25245 [Pokkaliibacter plantistimulans]